MAKRQPDDYIREYQAAHPELDFSQSVHINAITQVKAVCKIHGEVSKQSRAWVKDGCPECTKDKRRVSPHLTKAHEKFMIRGNSSWENYKAEHAEIDFLEAVYTGNRGLVKLRCVAHDFIFYKQPVKLMSNGAKCPKCVAESRKKTLGADHYLKLMHRTHGDRYKYPCPADNRQAIIEIVCATHGSFFQEQGSHILGRDCPTCTNEHRAETAKVTNAAGLQKAQVISRANRVENGRRSWRKLVASRDEELDFSKAVYVDSIHPVEVSCKKAGHTFRPTPSRLKQGSCCPKCTSVSSKPEIEVRNFVTSLGFVLEERDRKTLNGRELDMICHDKQIAIEFCGTYWHSTLPYENRKDATKNNVRTMHYAKYKECADKGIRLITMFGDEWGTKQAVVEKTLKHIFGVGGKLGYARDFEISVHPTREIRAFYDENHLQGSPAGGTSFCLIKDDEIYAAMSFSSVTSVRGSTKREGDWELVRFCTLGGIPGAASRLFKAFVRQENPKNIISYSDNRWFDGAMYPMLGFNFAGDVPVDYTVFAPKWNFRKHKGQFKRDRIPTRIKELGLDITFDPATDHRTEAEMTHEMGCGQVYDCGKKKWIWSEVNTHLQQLNA